MSDDFLGGIGRLFGGIFGGPSNTPDTDSDGFSFENLAQQALPVIGKTALGILQSNQAEDEADKKLALADKQYEQQLQLQREKAALDLKLAALKARYAGGSGGGGASTRLTDAQRLGLIQQQHELRNSSITSALNALQNAYGLGQR